MPLIDIGKTAPAFSLPDADNTTHALTDFRGAPVVLYFYPKDDTTGCTKQACAFRDLRPDFDAIEVTVLGISPDDAESHAQFTDKYDLNFTLLADVPVKSKDAGPRNKGTPVVCDAYGVWQQKSMYGKMYLGVVRTTYLIDARGTVARRWDKVNVDGHVEEVLEAVKALRPVQA
jgi:peroxiredoxin Q/BCP